MNFFVTAYHLKDALIAEGAAPRDDVEAAISSDDDLALVADLANLDKHRKLSKPPRSGHAPVVAKVSATGPSDGSEWRLSVNIEHGGRSVDGVELTQRVVDAWQRLLAKWRLR